MKIEKYIESIGNVSFKKNKRLKRLSLKVLPTMEVIVNIPYGYRFKEVERFIFSNKKWIEKQKLKYKSFLLENEFDLNTNFKTYYRSLHIKVANSSQTTINTYVSEDKIVILIPREFDIYTETNQRYIKNALISVIRQEAKVVLESRISEIALKHNFKYNKLSVKNIKSRWGSCSAKNNINLSIYLILLPQELIDYVIIHELCHTRIKNHSAAFWNLVEKVLGDEPKEYHSKLKKYFFSSYKIYRLILF